MRFGSIGRHGLLVLVAALALAGDAKACEVVQRDALALDDVVLAPATVSETLEFTAAPAEIERGEVAGMSRATPTLAPAEVPVRGRFLVDEVAVTRRRPRRMVAVRDPVANPFEVRISSGVVQVRPRLC
jgi:hypothetical protein